MAHIVDLKIDGLLGRAESVKFQLNRYVNVFFGENGSGKTTLLKALDAAMSVDGSAMLELPLTRASVSIYSIAASKVIKHLWDRPEEVPLSEPLSSNAETLNAPSASDLSPWLTVGTLYDSARLKSLGLVVGKKASWKLSPVTKSHEGKLTAWSHTFLPTTRLYYGNQTLGRPVQPKTALSDKDLDQAFSESVNRAWLQFYSRTLNEVRTIQESGLRTVLRQVLTPSSAAADSNQSNPAAIYSRVKSFLARQPRSDAINLGSQDAFLKRYENEADLRRIADNLDHVEAQIERSMAPVDNFLSTISSLFSRNKSLQLQNNELQVSLADGRLLPITSLSSGEKHLIKILLACMTTGPSTVLIDEPELSMHIDWQRTFVKTIRALNPECQLILATHSPEVMADIDDDCIFRL